MQDLRSNSIFKIGKRSISTYLESGDDEGQIPSFGCVRFPDLEPDVHLPVLLLNVQAIALTKAGRQLAVVIQAADVSSILEILKHIVFKIIMRINCEIEI